MLIGKKIVGLEWLTDKEAEQQGFEQGRYNKAQKIMLEDGTFITAMADPEGNGPGFLIIGDSKGRSWTLEPKK